jgi:cytochrome c-type biogenesis protein CcmE
MLVKTKTIVKILVGLIVIGGGIGYFMYQAMQSSWSYYYSVDEFVSGGTKVENHSFRLAGKVKPGSVKRDIQKMDLKFTLAGAKTEVPIHYAGTVPENFTDDIEVVVEGRLKTTGIFEANSLITRCESKYKAKVK